MYLQVINRYKTSIWFLFLNQHKYKSFGDNHFFREIYSLSSCDFKEFSAFLSNDMGMGNFHNSQLSLWSLFIIRFVLSMNDLFIFLPQLGSENTLVHYTPGKLSIDFFPDYLWFSGSVQNEPLLSTLWHLFCNIFLQWLKDECFVHTSLFFCAPPPPVLPIGKT